MYHKKEGGGRTVSHLAWVLKADEFRMLIDIVWLGYDSS